ncbi:hypothetical protein PFISCL1PPCAC_3130 [Pristionchus fissidentatus]|uniref:Uncharacterized protein n=1 Tax=Pristionchus fissidentatus TaxID=1538716 RepID=A0AAV5V087_9BILA|nr:hypothetical protein PFISCL1PPCAC_3130 [Pristionchus fissidentatus]
MDSASANSTQVLERTLTPQEQSQKIRDELDSLDDLWKRLAVDDTLKASIIAAAAKATMDHLCPQKKARRRLSVIDRTDAVLNMIKTTISQLNDLWDQVSMDEDRRLARVDIAYSHMESLLSDMVSSEMAMVQTIHEQMDEFKTKIVEMRRELGMTPFDMTAFPDKSVALWKALEADVKELHVQRTKVLEEQRIVIDRFAHLTSRLGSDCSDETAASLPDTSVLAPRATIDDLRERSARMEELLAERVERVKEAQRDINQWITRMGADYDENVAAVLEVDVRAEESALTATLMEQMDEIRATMAAQYEEWLSGREFEYNEHIARLAELWEMCCVEEEERRLPPSFDPTAPDSVDAAKEEVRRLEAIYDSRREVYEKVAVWKTHWTEKLQFESSENSLDKYTNRGGALDQRIKYENRLVKQLLPHAVQAVADAYSAYITAHPDDRVLIEGMEPLAYIRHVANTHDLEKEMEREQKVQARKAQLLQETKWGTTPGRSGAQLGRRPLTASASAARLGPAAKIARVGGATTPATNEVAAAAAADFTFDQSAISAISPTRKADKVFPKTSSPKGSRVTVAPGTRFASPAKGKSSATATPKRPLASANKK